MNSVPRHLLNEDRQEYEQLLDEALRAAPHRPELAAVVQRLSPVQLRTLALGATAVITAAAAAEYQHFVRTREDLRHPASSLPSSVHEAGPTDPGRAGAGLAASMGEAAETAGAGAAAVAAVLAPVLAGSAAAVFLLVGYVLKMLTPEPAFARTLLTTGWVFAAVTAGAILVAAVCLLLTALRNKPSADAGSPRMPDVDADADVAKAREAWREALLERGILPFLQEVLADPGPAAAPSTTPPPATTGRIPHLGYGRPGFSSPGDGGSGQRPRFSRPDYTSPDFGGPEHQPE